MAHGQYHHNRGSLRRFIRTEAGIANFPYAQAYPLDYGARYQAYGGFWDWLPWKQGGGGAAEGAAEALADGAGDAAKKGGFWKGAGSAGISTVGDVLTGIFTNKANNEAMAASLKSNEKIAMAKIAADRDAQIAIAAQQAAAQRGQGGMSGGTIALILTGVVVVGGVGFLVLRKKK